MCANNWPEYVLFVVIIIPLMCANNWPEYVLFVVIIIPLMCATTDQNMFRLS
jgi:hypothetical protein